MKEKIFSLFVFAFFAQLLLGQEKFTIRGEFPDNSLDGKYVLLIDKSYLLEERERRNAWKTLQMVDGLENVSYLKSLEDK